MFASLIFSLGIAAGCIFAAKILIHYFQLESYQFPGYFRTLGRNILKAVLPGICMTALLIISVTLLTKAAGENVANPYKVLIGAAIMAAGGIITGKALSEKKAKKPFVFTPRIKRLYAVSLIVMTGILFLALNCISHETGRFKPAEAFILIFPSLLPLWIALCGLIAWPVEKMISELYFRDAQRILKKRSDLIRIGITGSWGKTSVKFILRTILEEKYHTLATPASYNTPMGVTKIIRSRLEPGHRVFIAEMGARHVGDIREMCRLVHPEIGIITSVGPQHLDTFKTLERVTKTKYELIEALPEDGRAFFADDENICRELYEKTKIKDKHLTGTDSGKDEIWAEDIRYSPDGSSFYLCSKQEKVFCETQLLGELNIKNILLCASVAFSLGLSADQISRGIRKIVPVEHRLQLIRHPGGINVIDDAFNSNIRGAKQAFEVLNQFPSQRIIVTPGMVELGNQEYRMNREFGAYMAGNCDTAVLIGKKRSEAIAEGLRENGYPEDDIIIVSSLQEATELLKAVAKPGDTVLFENDLPDHYTES